MAPLTESQWIDKFLTALGPRLPSMQIAEAMEWAMRTYVDASDLDPTEAAEIFAVEVPPADPGAPGD